MRAEFKAISKPALCMLSTKGCTDSLEKLGFRNNVDVYHLYQMLKNESKKHKTESNAIVSGNTGVRFVAQSSQRR